MPRASGAGRSNEIDPTRTQAARDLCGAHCGTPVSLGALSCFDGRVEAGLSWGEEMRRREFITLVGSAAAAWPMTARAQQPAMPVIGYLSTGSRESDPVNLAAFRRGLGEIGYVEGQNVTIEYRWAESHYDRLSAMADDLVRRPVTAIAAIGGTPTALAAKAATSTIPVVFYIGIDPVEFGLVASLNRPGGNMTGVVSHELVAKRIEVLHELVPKAAVVAVLVNPTNSYTESETRAAHEGARSLGLRLHFLRASTVSEIDAVLGTLDEIRAGTLLISADLFLLSTNSGDQGAAPSDEQSRARRLNVRGPHPRSASTHFRFERVSVATSGTVRNLCGVPAHRKIGRAPGVPRPGARETGSELESGIDGCCWPARCGSNCSRRSAYRGGYPQLPYQNNLGEKIE
jgi:putative ABC transport system substrate-binding protein